MWTFEIADVSRSITGVDFLHYYGLSVDVCRSRLVDLNLGLVNLLKIVPQTICAVSQPRTWIDLMADFPKSSRESPVAAVFVHNVEHVLPTSGPPLFTRAIYRQGDFFEA